MNLLYVGDPFSQVGYDLTRGNLILLNLPGQAVNA
jgi:hypothetical protein